MENTTCSDCFGPMTEDDRAIKIRIPGCPFCGGGAVPVACKMLDRRYLAFEIGPETAETARQRVRDTQSPLFTMPPEQPRLLVDD